jgi:hypothetical protein
VPGTSHWTFEEEKVAQKLEITSWTVVLSLLSLDGMGNRGGVGLPPYIEEGFPLTRPNPQKSYRFRLRSGVGDPKDASMFTP